MDSRNLQLAHNLINYSVRLQKGEKLLIAQGIDGRSALFCSNQPVGFEFHYIGVKIIDFYVSL